MPQKQAISGNTDSLKFMENRVPNFLAKIARVDSERTQETNNLNIALV